MVCERSTLVNIRYMKRGPFLSKWYGLWAEPPRPHIKLCRVSPLGLLCLFCNDQEGKIGMSVFSQDIIIITVLIQLFVMFTFVLISLVKPAFRCQVAANTLLDDIQFVKITAFKIRGFYWLRMHESNWSLYLVITLWAIILGLCNVGCLLSNSTSPFFRCL